MAEVGQIPHEGRERRARIARLERDTGTVEPDVMVRSAAAMATIGFVLVAGFQAALALGAPWGRAAWGGANERLPNALRIASGFAAALWVVAALVVLARAGVDWSPIPFSVATWGTWVLFGLLVLGTVMNLASRSRLERLIQTPVAAVLAILCLLVALA